MLEGTASEMRPVDDKNYTALKKAVLLGPETVSIATTMPDNDEWQWTVILHQGTNSTMTAIRYQWQNMCGWAYWFAGFNSCLIMTD